MSTVGSASEADDDDLSSAIIAFFHTSRDNELHIVTSPYTMSSPEEAQKSFVQQAKAWGGESHCRSTRR